MFAVTALITAAIGGHDSTVALLLAKEPELIHIVNPRKQTALHFTKKASIAKQLLDHEPELVKVSRKFAEEQYELGLSSALFIPGVIDIVKSYIFVTQEVEKEDEPSLKRHKSESEVEEWEENDL